MSNASPIMAFVVSSTGYALWLRYKKSHPLVRDTATDACVIFGVGLAAIFSSSVVVTFFGVPHSLWPVTFILPYLSGLGLGAHFRPMAHRPAYLYMACSGTLLTLALLCLAFLGYG